MTVAELLRATREFYTKRKKRWGIGHLYDDYAGINSYCVLGAMSAVVSNDDHLKASPGRTLPGPSFKEYELIREASAFLADALELPGDSKFARTYDWNDWATRSEVLAGLREAERLAREQGL